ncbi:hypothetical protein IFVP5_C2190006 [Vibrio parahaemolyticus]
MLGKISIYLNDFYVYAISTSTLSLSMLEENHERPTKIFKSIATASRFRTLLCIA